MKIEILCIGDEIVTGQVQDQNSFFLARSLFSVGIQVQAIAVVPDDVAIIKEHVQASLKKADFLILSGGMGHTLDDHTKATIAELFKQDLVHDEKVEKDLIARFGPDLKSLEHQCKVFKQGRAYTNPIGTAPMLMLDVEDKQICLLPGVPRELRAMYDTYLEKILIQKNPSAAIFQESIYFCNMKESDLDPYVRKLAEEHSEISFGIYPKSRIVRLSLKSRVKIPDILIESIESLFPQSYRVKSGLIEEALLEILEQKKFMITFAESCSAGALVSRLSAIAGASNVLGAAFVTYSNQMKHELLHVEIETIQAKGAVSRETVIQMAQGALDKSGANVAIATSGIAGPTGGSKKKPIGTVYICLTFKEGPLFAGLVPIIKNLSRQQIIETTATFAFSVLYQYLKSGIEPTFADQE